MLILLPCAALLLIYFFIFAATLFADAATLMPFHWLYLFSAFIYFAADYLRFITIIFICRAALFTWCRHITDYLWYRPLILLRVFIFTFHFITLTFTPPRHWCAFFIFWLSLRYFIGFLRLLHWCHLYYWPFVTLLYWLISFHWLLYYWYYLLFIIFITIAFDIYFAIIILFSCHAAYFLAAFISSLFLRYWLFLFIFFWFLSIWLIFYAMPSLIDDAAIYASITMLYWLLPLRLFIITRWFLLITLRMPYFFIISFILIYISLMLLHFSSFIDAFSLSDIAIFIFSRTLPFITPLYFSFIIAIHFLSYYHVISSFMFIDWFLPFTMPAIAITLTINISIFRHLIFISSPLYFFDYALIAYLRLYDNWIRYFISCWCHWYFHYFSSIFRLITLLFIISSFHLFSFFFFRHLFLFHYFLIIYFSFLFARYIYFHAAWLFSLILITPDYAIYIYFHLLMLISLFIYIAYAIFYFHFRCFTMLLFHYFSSPFSFIIISWIFSPRLIFAATLFWHFFLRLFFFFIFMNIFIYISPLRHFHYADTLMSFSLINIFISWLRCFSLFLLIIIAPLRFHFIIIRFHIDAHYAYISLSFHFHFLHFHIIFIDIFIAYFCLFIILFITLRLFCHLFISFFMLFIDFRFISPFIFAAITPLYSITLPYAIDIDYWYFISFAIWCFHAAVTPFIFAAIIWYLLFRASFSCHYAAFSFYSSSIFSLAARFSLRLRHYFSLLLLYAMPDYFDATPLTLPYALPPPFCRFHCCRWWCCHFHCHLQITWLLIRRWLPLMPYFSLDYAIYARFLCIFRHYFHYLFLFSADFLLSSFRFHYAFIDASPDFYYFSEYYFLFSSLFLIFSSSSCLITPFLFRLRCCLIIDFHCHFSLHYYAAISHYYYIIDALLPPMMIIFISFRLCAAIIFRHFQMPFLPLFIITIFSSSSFFAWLIDMLLLRH